jgi:glycosyltransferase involved in cell wall biosynthesis
VIGYVGVTGIQDGVDHLLVALHHLKCDLGRSDFVCVIVGGGQALPFLKGLSGELGLLEHVVFTGWVEDQGEVARYIAAMDICVAPEPSDPYNDRSTAAKVMEYMALGKPVVAFDLPEHRYTGRRAGIYARPNDDRDLATRIALLMDDSRQREEMGQAGRERVQNELAWHHQARYLLKGYANLMKTRCRQ